MRSIFGLFARSPFGPLQAHMEKVAACVRMLPELIGYLRAGDQEGVVRVARAISVAESEADQVKNDLRAHLPSSVFLPVDRRDLLEILAVQDAIADKAEDVGVLLTLRKLAIPEGFDGLLEQLLARVMEAVDLAVDVNQELDTLLEASFGGPEAKQVAGMIDKVSRAEHEADKILDQLARRLYSMDEGISPAQLILWAKVIETLSSVADRAETMANRLRLMLAS